MIKVGRKYGCMRPDWEFIREKKEGYVDKMNANSGNY